MEKWEELIICVRALEIREIKSFPMLSRENGLHIYDYINQYLVLYIETTKDNHQHVIDVGELTIKLSDVPFIQNIG